MTVLLIAVAAVLLLALGTGVWLVIQMVEQQARLANKLDSLSGRITAFAVSDEQPQPTATVGGLAPRFTLPLAAGGRTTLAELLAPAKPLMLIFTNPRCGPCYELLPDLAAWEQRYGERMSFALISAGTPETNLAMTAGYDVGGVALQRDDELISAYGITQMPAAILIRPDGIVATEQSYGAHGVRSAVADALGLAMPEPPAREEVPVAGHGDPTPALRRPDLNGNVVDFGALRGAPTMVLFWSPGCTHCNELLPEIKAFEAMANRVRLLIVSRGPIALNAEVGFTSTVLLDDDRSVSRTFGVTGTPAALLIDSQGIVAAPLARGLLGVRRALKASVISSPPSSLAS